MANIYENVLKSLDPSGNDNDERGLVPPNHQPRRSSQGQMPHRHFEIDKEVLITILQDNDEPKTIKEALSSPNKEK